MRKYFTGFGLPAAMNGGSVLTTQDDKKEAAEARLHVARKLNVDPSTLAKPSVQGSMDHDWIYNIPPIKIPEPSTSKLGDTPSQKKKMIEDWLTRPSTKPERAALAKRYREQTAQDVNNHPVVKYVDRMIQKYDNWGSKKVKS
tara:strand:+ start:2578 stop:3006 length:429 start_codon:yes stop_codon:yes gene_type:complete